MVKAERRAEVNDKAKDLCEERLLDILIPPARKRQHAPALDTGPTIMEEEDNQTTREKFRQKLRAGQLEEKMLELDVPSTTMPQMQVIGPMNLEDMGINLAGVEVILRMMQRMGEMQNQLEHLREELDNKR